MFESPWHWAVVVLVGFLLFFGWKQLPDMARSLGRSLRIFKTEIKGMSEDDKAREEADAKRKELPAADLVKREPVVPPSVTQSVPPPNEEPVARPRPRPTPSPNGRTEAGAKTE